VPASPGSDIVRNPAVVPTGRNIYGLDPYNVPSAVAQDEGTRIANDMIAQLSAQQGAVPETVAIVLWGIDNLKSGGEGIAQVLALIGARVVLDELGKTSDVELIPLAELGRPRIDVVVTVSGIFRDLLHHQMVLLDKAVQCAAAADEPPEQNFVRKHALAQAAELNTSLEEAATRIFANAPGSYGANVNHMVESGTWEEETQLSDTFLSRKSFSFRNTGAEGQWRDSRAIMERALSTVDATFQNIDSFEVGISDIDYYYESLGGVTKSVELLRGKRPPVMVADAVASTERLSSLEQMVRLETRAKLLNPKWFEGMLAHGSEGVREIEARVNNTYGWSVTAGAVEDWAYQGVAETFLLDEQMRDRLAKLNPHAVTGMTRRLLEASARGFWEADEATLASLQDIYDDLEDQLEGFGMSNVIG
jgi:magnesium chelatase subunit H